MISQFSLSSMAERLRTEYSGARSEAIESLDAGRLDRGLSFARYAAQVAWRYPILRAYSDRELERQILKAVKSVAVPARAKHSEQGVTLFYTTKITDRGALVEQYVLALVGLGRSVVLVVPTSGGLDTGPEILERFRETGRVRVIVARRGAIVQKYEDIVTRVSGSGVREIFLHADPADPLGLILGGLNEAVPRYLIVHNDHTFWLGVTAADTFVEFRPIGVGIAVARRGIDPKSIVKIPYYPIADGQAFLGFPFPREGKTVILSAGALYKYYLDPELCLLRTLKELVRTDPRVQLCLAGPGDQQRMKEALASLGVRDRISLLGYRPDFDALVRASDLLVESYPLRGGLVGLYAVRARLCCVGLAEETTPSQSMERDLEIPDYRSPREFSELLERAAILISNQKKRVEQAERFAEYGATKETFESDVRRLLAGEAPSVAVPEEETRKLDDERFLRQYMSLPFGEFDLLAMKAEILGQYLPVGRNLSLWRDLRDLQRVGRGRSASRAIAKRFFREGSPFYGSRNGFRKLARVAGRILGE